MEFKSNISLMPATDMKKQVSSIIGPAVGQDVGHGFDVGCVDSLMSKRKGSSNSAHFSAQSSKVEGETSKIEDEGCKRRV